MGSFLVIAAVIVAVAAFIWAVSAHQAKVNKRIDAAWSQTARRVGGQFTPVQGPWYNQKARNLTANVDGVVVLADHYTVSTGKSSITYTRVRSTAAAPEGLKLQVFRKHALSGLGQALGFQDVPTGDCAFDESHTIKSNSPDLVPVWVDRKVRKRVEELGAYAFGVQDNELVARKVGIEEDPKVLEAVLEVSARLASQGTKTLARWKNLASKLGGTVKSRGESWKPDGSTSIQAPWHDIPIVIDMVSERSGLMGGREEITTRVRGRRGQGERFCVGRQDPPPGLVRVPIENTAVELFSNQPDHTRRRFDDRTVEALARFRSARVEAEGDTVTLLFEGVLMDVSEAETAVELVGRLCSDEHFGPYR